MTESNPAIEFDPATKAQLVIADFNDRRTEINNLTTAQHVLISLNITAAGAITGLVFTQDDPNIALLLLLVPVCTTMAMLWANHAHTIRHIGWYIRYCIRPLVEPDEDAPLWRWELDHDTFDPSRSRWGAKWLKFVVPMMLTFIGPPVFGVAYAFEAMVLHGDAGSLITYSFALLMLLYGGALLMMALVPGDRPPPSRTSSGPR
jgi:hypothetical protein